MIARQTIAVLCGVFLGSAAAGEESASRATVWDLKPGQPIDAQPLPDAYRVFACGSNGGPPHQRLSGWSDFQRCRAEPNGLHEVYFEYDDEYEYVARAKDLPLEVSRWAGTSEVGFSVIVSALFDDDGTLKGIRIVTDSRLDHRNDIIEPDLKKRAQAYRFGAIMAARYDFDPARDCRALPAAEGEGTVGSLFVKQSCERTDTTRGVKIFIQANYFRKPGQSGTNPQAPSQLTEGQFESSARLEILTTPVVSQAPGSKQE
jgi:hypothetical protein